MAKYLQSYRSLCGNIDLIDNDPATFEKECFDLFTAALKDGDRRMAFEVQDCILNAYTYGADVNDIIRHYDLLVRYFPDIATQTLELMRDYEF